MRQLLIATRNAHKTREFAEILGSDFAVRDLSEDLEAPAIEETGATFGENATLKAVAASTRCSGLVVADDSGLEVDALNGAPGIYSARFAGPDASDEQNISRLLADLAEHPGGPSFAARFRCVLALARRGKLIRTFDGIVEGTIVHPPRGNGGFGYDSVFQPAGSEKTFGELPAAEKNRISHRANAILLLRAALLS
jgi:XTP/dITP diphosphohydrolase